MRVQYLLYRWLLSLTTIIFFLHSLCVRISLPAGWKYVLYLTNWSRVLSVLHFTTEAVLVTARWWRERRERGRLDLSSAYSSEPSLPLSHRVLWVLANINSDTAALCTIVYWGFLYDGREFDVDNVSGHILISLINILDVFISHRPWRCLHLYHVQLFCLVYVMSNLAYIEGGGTNLADKPYIYSILNWSHPAHCVLTILGVVLVLPFIHFIFIILYK